MDGFVRAIGDGITGLVAGAFDVIGDAVRGLVDAGDRALPGGLFAAALFVIVVIVGWNLAKR